MHVRFYISIPFIEVCDKFILLYDSRAPERQSTAYNLAIILALSVFFLQEKCQDIQKLALQLDEVDLLDQLGFQASLPNLVDNLLESWGLLEVA